MKLRRLIGPLGTALTLGQVAIAVREHWHGLAPDQRERLAELARHSKGDPRRLTRPEIREIFGALELPRLARKTVRVVALSRRTGRGRA